MQRKTFSGRLNHRILLCRIIPGYNPKAVITKKRHLDSHRSTVTTQTQNKTRQNYYAIFLSCRGGIPCLTYLYSHTHKKLYQAICIINNAPIRILFTRVLKKMKLRRLFNKKNGTPIHIAAPSQHKHKIKHDKTTMQSSCYAGEAYSLTHIYSHTYKQPSGDLHIYNIPIFVLFTKKRD